MRGYPALHRAVFCGRALRRKQLVTSPATAFWYTRHAGADGFKSCLKSLNFIAQLCDFGSIDQGHRRLDSGYSVIHAYIEPLAAPAVRFKQGMRVFRKLKLGRSSPGWIDILIDLTAGCCRCQAQRYGEDRSDFSAPGRG